MTDKQADDEVGQVPVPPTIARTGAVAAVPSELDDKVVPRKQVWSWALWDWATQPFNTVILTFVFAALYLTSESFIDPEIVALGEDILPSEARSTSLRLASDSPALSPAS